jgi:hypothetical protein
MTYDFAGGIARLGFGSGDTDFGGGSPVARASAAAA